MISTLLVADERMNDSEPEFYVNFSGFTKSAKSDSNSVDETKFWAEANRLTRIIADKRDSLRHLLISHST